jgi:hypothetical protein
LCIVRAAIVQQLRSNCKAIENRSLSNFQAIVKCLRIEVMVKCLRIVRAAIVQLLQDYCKATAKRSQSDIKEIV